MLQEALFDTIYAISASDEAVGWMLRDLASHFGCNSAALLFTDDSQPASDLATTFGVIDRMRNRYQREFAHLDPAPAALASLPIRHAAATDRIFSAEERASSTFLREFYYRAGLFEALGGPITVKKGRFGIVAVHRGLGRIRLLFSAARAHRALGL